MVKEISKGLKLTFFVNFVVSLSFGIIFFFMLEIYAEWTGLSISPPFYPYFGGLFGGALLAFAIASFDAWRQNEWDKVKIIVIMEIIWYMLGSYIFFWVTIFNPFFLLSINLIYPIIFFGFLATFIFFYIKHQK